MTLKIFGHAGALCTKRVIITLNELNVPYELILVDLLKGEQKHPDFLAKHPFGKIPLMEDEGENGELVRVFESRAICKYLANKHSDKARLMPEDKDLVAWAKFQEACDIEMSYFDKNAATAVFEAVFAPMRGLKTNEEILKKSLSAFDDTLKAYDQILANRKFVAGDEFTVADIFHAPYGQVIQGVGAKESFEKYPNVKRWWAEITSRETFKALEATFP